MHARATSKPRAGAPVAVLTALTLALAIGCASTQPPPELTGTPEAYRVGPPDELLVTIFPEPVIERSLVVRPDGMISVDLIGDVQAQGRTPEEIAAEIEERIARYKRDPRVTIAVQAARSTQITVLGEVEAPRTFPIQRVTRVVEAIGSVGGPTLFAAKSRVRVVRYSQDQARVFRVNLDAIQSGDLSTNLILQEGDLVFVPPTRWASVGYAIGSVLFPFHQLLGFGANVTTRVFTGGF